jgi:hypothetical protein
MPRCYDAVSVLAAASLALLPTPGFAAPLADAAIAGRSCAQIRAMITERMQDMGVAFGDRLDLLINPARTGPGGIPLPPPRVTVKGLYAAVQKTRARPGAVILGLQARIEADLAALKAAGCPDYDLPTDPETYWTAAVICRTARLYDDMKAVRREPEYITAVACDRTRWAVGQPISEPGLIVDPPPLPLPDGPGAP